VGFELSPRPDLSTFRKRLRSVLEVSLQKNQSIKARASKSSIDRYGRARATTSLAQARLHVDEVFKGS
jgi:hypothetical protein